MISDSLLGRVQSQLEEQKPVPVESANSLPVDIGSEVSFPSLGGGKSGSVVNRGWQTKATSAPAAESRSSKSSVTHRLEIPYDRQSKQSQFGKQTNTTQVVKDIMTKYATSIEISTNRKNGLITCLISGNPDAVDLSRRELVKTLTVQITAKITIPLDVRPHLVGKKGANLKALMARTLTNIQLAPREQDETDQSFVTVTGDSESIALAKKEIDQLIASRASKYASRVLIDQSFHVFIFGPGGSRFDSLQKEYNVKLSTASPDTTDKNPDEITLVGEKSNVEVAEAYLNKTYQELQRTLRTISIPVRKKQHRFIVGPKGSVLAEIFEKTGCNVNVPAQSDEADDKIVVRGPESMLSVALQLVLEKANSILIDEIEVANHIPATTNADKFTRLLYIRDRSTLKEIETVNDVTIYQQSGANGPLFEIQAKSRDSLETAKKALSTMIKDKGRELYIEVVDIPQGLHKFILGRGGQSILKLKAKPEWAGRLLDVVFPQESDESDEVLIIVKRHPNAPSLAESNKEIKPLIEKIKQSVLQDAQTLADLVTEHIKADPKLHGRLIGAGGSTLKEILAPFDNAVSIRFPNKKDADQSIITIRGSKSNVEKVCQHVHKMISEFKHLEIMTSFSEDIVVSHAHSSRLLAEGGTGRLISMVVRNIRSQFANKKFKLSPSDKQFEQDLTGSTGLLYLSAEVTSKGDTDIISIKGPKTFVSLAKVIVQERVQEIIDTVTENFNVFDSISKAALQVLAAEGGEELKTRALSRIIGKEGKAIKKLQDDHSVQIKLGKSVSEAVEHNDDVNPSPAETQSLGDLFIKGGRKGVASAKAEILEVVESAILTSFSLQFTVPKNTRSTIVGRAGSNLNELRNSYQVRIDLNDSIENADEIEVVLEGTKQGCLDAKAQIEKSIDDLVNSVSETFPLPSSLHRLVIGAGGMKLKAFMEEFGGQIKIQFPKAGVDPAEAQNSVIITANSKIIKQACTEFERFLVQCISEYSSAGASSKQESVFYRVLSPKSKDAVVAIATIPRSDLASVLGKSRDVAVSLMSKHGVTIWTDEFEEPESESVNITIVGPNNELTDSIKLQLLSKIRAKKAVTIPAEILTMLTSSNPYQRDHVSYLQDQIKRAKTDGVGVELSPGTLQGKTDSTIVIRGETGKISRVEKQLTRFLDDWKSKTFYAAVEIPIGYRAHIIGRAGQTINRVRDESGALLDLNRSKNESEPDRLIIRGKNQAAVDKASGMISVLLEEQANRIKRDIKRESLNSKPQNNEPHVARIDDQLQQLPAGNAGVPGYAPPGFNGKSSSGSSNIKIASAVALSLSSPTEYLGAFPQEIQDPVWQAVGKKGAKTATVDSVLDVDSSETKKKKKKNKKVEQELAAPQTVPLIPPVSSIPAVVKPAPPPPVTEEWQTVKESSKKKK